MDAVSSEHDGYDADLHQVIEHPPLNVGRLLFQRWLVDCGLAEHAPAGDVAGELVYAAADYTIANPGARRAWIPTTWSAAC